MTPKQFEGITRELLALAGMTVRPELLLGHKKVDTYAEERRMNKLHRIAVECKDYASKLTQAQLSVIIANYQPLYDANLIDEILLVTAQSLTPSAEAMIRQSRVVYHMTLSELEASVIDFAGYLTYLQEDLRTDHLDEYYIRPCMTSGEDLESYVDAWITTDRRPLAVIAGYGMGKTSFVRHYAASLAKRAQTNAASRVPIIFKLTDISAEQSVEGLVSRTLATHHLVRNYSYNSFMALNRRGRFVVFLDGFDEMKHTLTWNEFRFNMAELNKLIDGDSRVILLGRPNAFLSDDEHQYVLHGMRRINEEYVKDPTWPDFIEVSLQAFDQGRVREFLNKYTAVLRLLRDADASEGPGVEYDADEISARIGRLPPDRLEDLATRPVQLKILTEVLPQWKESDAASLTVSKMYNTFIRLIIDREQRKLTRGEFTADERLAFARSVAYWLWISSGAMNVAAEDIPDHLLPQRTDIPADAIRRDLVSACFLERKLADRLYFPHRSFQEYLVAEALLFDLRADRLTVETMSKAISPDVGSFIAEMAIAADASKCDTLLNDYRGTISLPALLPWLVSEQIERIEARLFRRRPERWDIIMYAAAGIAGKIPPKAVSLRIKDGLPDLPARDQLSAFLSLCWLAGYPPGQPESIAALWEALSTSHPLSTKYGGALGERVLTRVHVVVPRLGTGGVPRIDVAPAVEWACDEIKHEAVIAEWDSKYIGKNNPLPTDVAPSPHDGFSGSFHELLYWLRHRSQTAGA